MHRIVDKRVVLLSDTGEIETDSGVDYAANGGGRNIGERNWQNSALLHPASGVRRKHPDLVGRDVVKDVEATQNVDRVVEDGDATGQSARVARRPVSSNGSDNVCYRIITEDTTSLGLGGRLRAAHAIDVVRSTVVSHSALDVAHEGIWISGCLGSPTVADRIILERISELDTTSLQVAATHRIKLPVGREKDTTKADPRGWEVSAG